ncbi:PTS mannose/fructose/sorbose transporter subunit IIC [Clostridium sp. MSJ-4]|uniref:PTS mannose/fructose/sorbose transporter subunit IIC n=1 Tax=Clostridium simiarum TaxID=2841506 RepID=A0ABS6F1Q9_9CLOT|nr:PTS mannose/fructose/sorbose transporter subunit IIC [Clostridium simiarum]MBU5592454.1 PTS mannose/fructose/sorbose transporter subunit IIC [Clostridium simiarum]
MQINAFQIILIFIVASIAGIGSILDEFQTHRPLIACTLIGLVLGDVKTGIILGGTLELMALGWMNIGAAVAPDAAMASVVASILVIAAKQSVSAGIAIAIPIAAAGQVFTIFARTLTVGLQHRADRYAEEGNLRGIDICHLSGLAIQALRVAIPALIVSLISPEAVNHLLASIPVYITEGLRVAGGFIVVVGYAMVINMMEAKYLMPFFFLGFVIAAFTQFNLVALGVLGAVFAIVYVQLNPKYHAAAAGSVDDLDDL